MSDTKEPPKKPIHVIRSGALSVSIWKKEAKDNGCFYTANVQRCYKGKDDAWHYSDSFSRDELPVVGWLLNMAFIWVCMNEAKAAKEKSQGQ